MSYIYRKAMITKHKTMNQTMKEDEEMYEIYLDWEKSLIRVFVVRLQNIWTL